MKVKNFLVLVLVFVFASVAFAVPNRNVYGILTETFSGANIDADKSDENAVRIDLWKWTGGQQGFSVDNVSDSTIEGKVNWLLTATNAGTSGGGGFAVNNNAGVLDMTAYSNGYIKFLVKTSYAAMINFKIGVKADGKEYYKTLKEINPLFSANDKWYEISVPVSDIVSSGLDKVQYLFLFGLDEAFYNVGDKIEIDNIRWEKPETTSAEQMILSMAKVGTDEAVTSDTFSFDVNVDTDLADSTWKAANEYIKIDLNWIQFDTSTSTSDPCYVRFYTNNTSTAAPIVANPKYEGGDNPAGLINENDTSARIDACWRVSTYTITKDKLKIYQIDYDLSDKKDEKTYCYIWMQDLKTSGFDNEYSLIWNNGSDISKRGTQLYGATFLAGRFPLYVYIGANFAQAVIGSTYSTNTLTVELYYE
ncbi:hypothetical protein [Candidatus Ruminimicrobium bovinum]|uniref:hypothetical protein n=1 Tax=Candidatus Ruminimicrobium bovinum TaxID=3242779 RepID=UPI0039B919B5